MLSSRDLLRRIKGTESLSAVSEVCLTKKSLDRLRRIRALLFFSSGPANDLVVESLEVDRRSGPRVAWLDRVLPRGWKIRGPQIRRLLELVLFLAASGRFAEFSKAWCEWLIGVESVFLSCAFCRMETLLLFCDKIGKL